MPANCWMIAMPKMANTEDRGKRRRNASGKLTKITNR